MNDRSADRSDHDAVREAVQGFYEQHPYPPPSALDGYRRRWEDDGRRRADFHLHFPEAAYRGNLQVLVAGCGTSQAARHALRRPGSHVVGIDVSAASLGHTDALKRKHGLSNLEVDRLPVERAGELGRSFDLIICTGVLHHLPDPAEGLSALRGVLAPDGADPPHGLWHLRPGRGRPAAGILPPAGGGSQRPGNPGSGPHPDRPAAQPPVGAAARGVPRFPEQGCLGRCASQSAGARLQRAAAARSHRIGGAALRPVGAAGAVPAPVQRLGRNPPCRPFGGAAAEGAVCRSRIVSRDHAAPQPDRLPG